ncbi:hypothetical protein B0H14DRAFT_3905828 [Mycena olivaceomarginata]|nr:hypothetical protein B0H14DRAFT_3905828 [Mycena olivaceomarginata]
MACCGFLDNRDMGRDIANDGELAELAELAGTIEVLRDIAALAGTLANMGEPLLLPAALGALIWLRRKYDCTNILATTVAHITRINPTTLNAYDDALLLVNGMYKPTQIAPHQRLSSDLAVGHENGIAAALACHVQLLDGLTCQDGTRASLPPLSLCRCLVGRKRLLVKQFQSGYTLSWLRAWSQSPTCGDAAHCANALQRVREGGCRGDGNQAQEGVGGVARVF